MTIRHLKIFVEVVDAGSMTGAAKKLFISQPSVSQAIAELEDFYEIKLFERLSKQLFITEDGKRLLSYARHILTSFDEMDRTMRHSSESSTLRVGASITIGTYILSSLYRDFIYKFPNSHIYSIIDNTLIIEEMVLKSQLDFGLVEGPIHSDDIISKPFMDDELILVCGSQHPLRAKKAIPLMDLESERLILREKGSGTRELFENTMLSRGHNMNIVWECNSTEAIKRAVIANIGVSIISKMMVEENLRSGNLFKIEICDTKFTREFNIIYHKNKYLSQKILDFWDLVLNISL